jgi:hypothetical protein
LTGDCEPYAFQETTTDDKKIKKDPIAPCGAIANSLFNDTFQIKRWDETRSIDNKFSYIRIVREGIAWATDKNSKFRNPPLPDGQPLSVAFAGYAHPPNWQKNVWELDPNRTSNNGYQNEALIVWMRTAALPTFSKLYARVDHSAEGPYHNSLPQGLYQVEIAYNYPVASFKGTKHFIISNTSWLGGKNPFLGVAYVIVGLICLVLSGVFLFIHRKFGKSTSELLNVNQRTPYLT